MSTTIKAGLRDTFDSLARRAYGNANRAALLSHANPGILEPIPFGTVLTVPADPYSPALPPVRATANTANTVNISIGGRKIQNWSRLTWTRSIDTYRTFEFDTQWDPEDPADRETFRPFAFKRGLISVNNDVVLTGTPHCVPRPGQREKNMNVSGSSLPHVLAECNMPISAFPMTFKNQDLEQIATRVCRPFGLGVKFLHGAGDGFGEIKFYQGKKFKPKAAADPDAILGLDGLSTKQPKEKKPFDKLSLEPDEFPLDFLFDLARLRGGLFTDDEWGHLCFIREAPTGRPVATLIEGQSPQILVEPWFDPTMVFSDVTGWRPSATREKGGSYTTRNRHLSGVVRPSTFRADGSEAGALRHTTEAKLGRMYPAMCAWDVSVPSWRNPEGLLWEPNTTLWLEAPEAMIYNKYEFLIREVQYTREGSSERALLNVVLPGSFSGKTPERMPWD